MEKIKTSLIVFLIFCICSVCVFAQSDKTDKYNEALEYLKENNIIYVNEDFDINNTVSRAEGACIMARAIGNTYEYTDVVPVFDDVGKNHWAVAYIDQLYKYGIVNGVGNELFCPDDYLTYEQFIKMAVCFMGLEAEAYQLGGYSDGFLVVAQEYGFLENINFSKNQIVNSGDVALILYRVVLYKENEKFF